MLKEINSESFEKLVLNNEKPTVVEVYTNSCPNCKRLHPIFEDTAYEHGKVYSFYKLDAHKNIELVKKYKILGVPTLLFFKEGKLLDKKTGVISKQKIIKRLKPLLHYSQEEIVKKEVKGYFKLPWK